MPARKKVEKEIVVDQVLDGSADMRTLSQLNWQRESLAAYLGKSFGGRRKLYDTLGYPKTILFNDYMARYRRQEIAKACINIPVKACWRKPPIIFQGGSDLNPFETAWAELASNRKIYRYMSRVDRLAAIGTYGALFFGVDDNVPVSEPIVPRKGMKLTYLIPCSEKSANITQWVTDNKDERYGLPEMYSINTRTGNAPQVMNVHWTRVIHVTEEALESDVYGTPQLEAIYNRLQDLECVVGGSAEMFWRGALQGLAFIMDKDSRPTEDEKKKFRTQIENYIHDLDRILRLKGMDVKQIAPQISDPTGQFNVIVNLICAERRIPKRILIGSEEGQLASGQDEENWASRVLERQLDHCEPIELRPTIDRFSWCGIIPEPEGDYSVKWPNLAGENRAETAHTALEKSQALAAYTRSAGADGIIPPEIYLSEILGLDQTLVAKIQDILAKAPKKEVPVGVPGNGKVGGAIGAGVGGPSGKSSGKNLPVGTFDGANGGGRF
jgi:hypothetical protein